jgi:hypothetical protein
VEQSKKKYDEKIKELTGKKIALFKKGDVKLWKCKEEEVDEAKSYKTDFEMAKRFILPKVFLDFILKLFRNPRNARAGKTNGSSSPSSATRRSSA